MVMIDCNEYMNSLADKYSNLLGHASDHSEVLNSEFDGVLPCTCDDCVREFLTGMDPVFDEVPFCNKESVAWMAPLFEDEDGSPEEYLAESVDEAATEVVENLAFLGDGTTSKDVMISILALEAAIAQVKIFLLESE